MRYALLAVMALALAGCSAPVEQQRADGVAFAANRISVVPYPEQGVTCWVYWGNGISCLRDSAP